MVNISNQVTPNRELAPQAKVPDVQILAAIDIGLIKFQPDIDQQSLLKKLKKYLPKDVKILSKQEFIKASVTQAKRQKNEKIRTARRITAVSLVAVVVSTGLGLMALQKTQQAELNLANARGFSSLSLFDRGKELEAFVEAIKAGKTLQKQQASDTKVTNALQELLNRKSERNHLEGHDSAVTSVNFSPDGKTLKRIAYAPMHLIMECFIFLCVDMR